jgi:hypothetical protein
MNGSGDGSGCVVGRLTGVNGAGIETVGHDMSS